MWLGNSIRCFKWLPMQNRECGYPLHHTHRRNHLAHVGIAGLSCQIDPNGSFLKCGTLSNWTLYIYNCLDYHIKLVANICSSSIKYQSSIRSSLVKSCEITRCLPGRHKTTAPLRTMATSGANVICVASISWENTLVIWYNPFLYTVIYIYIIYIIINS